MSAIDFDACFEAASAMWFRTAFALKYSGSTISDRQQTLRMVKFTYAVAFVDEDAYPDIVVATRH